MLVCGPPVRQLQCPVTAAVGPPWGGRCSQSGAEWFGGGGREGEVRRTKRKQQNNEMNTYAREKEQKNEGIIRRYQEMKIWVFIILFSGQ